jgi:inorganic phosphate transporter, PiT family
MNPIVLAVAMALLFGLTNGINDSANAVAGLVATRAASPRQAVTLAAIFEVLGVLAAGTAVAKGITGIVMVPKDQMVAVVGAGLTGALGWNLLTWVWGLPSSSSHGLVGGLLGATIMAAGAHAIVWGNLSLPHPKGVAGVLASLAVSPLLGFLVGLLGGRSARRATLRARRSIERPIRRAEWVTSATLAFSHGANDSQKTMGVIALVLVASGKLSHFGIPMWVKLAVSAVAGAGTALGGWRIIKTVARRIYRIRSLDGLVGQATSAAIIFMAAAVGGPVSTTHVVASSVVGVGAGQRRHHVRWAVVREMGLAWLITLPAAGLFGATAFSIWRWL